MAKEQFDWKRLIAIIGIGFISILLIIFFIGADLFQFFGGAQDPNTIAVVNGKKVHRFDFMNYLRRLPSYFQNEQMQDYAFNRFIQDILLLQLAEKEGFTVSDDRLVENINNYIEQSRQAILNNPRGDYSFQQSVKKWDNPRLLQEILRLERQSLAKFTSERGNELVRTDLMQYIMLGSVVASSDLRFEYIAENSTIQIRYASVSMNDLRKRFKNRIAVTEAEITEELNRNKKEIKDPKTDRERIKKKLEKDRFEKLKNEFVKSINDVSKEGGSFTRAASLMNGRVSVSTAQKIGENLIGTGSERIPLTSITTSNVFLEDFFAIETGQASRVIETATTLYIFTPLVKNIVEESPDPSELAGLENRLRERSFSMLYSNLMRKITEEARIVKNLKTGQ